MTEAFQILMSSEACQQICDQTVRDSLERIKNMQTSSRGVLQLMRDYHSSQCLDPRDRIAALQGLVLTKSGRPFQHVLKRWPITDPECELLDSDKEILWLVDYKKDWVSNYSNFTAFLISRGFEDEIHEHLGLFGNLARLDGTYPSWVPNWTSSCLSNPSGDADDLLIRSSTITCIEQVPYIVKMYKSAFAPPTCSHTSTISSFTTLGIVRTVMNPSDWLREHEADGFSLRGLCQEFEANLRKFIIPSGGHLKCEVVPLSQLLLQSTNLFHRHWPKRLYIVDHMWALMKQHHDSRQRPDLRRAWTISRCATMHDIIHPLLRYRITTHSFFLTKNGIFGMSAIAVQPGDILATADLGIGSNASNPSAWRVSETEFLAFAKESWLLRPEREGAKEYKMSGKCYSGQIHFPRLMSNRNSRMERARTVESSSIRFCDPRSKSEGDDAQRRWQDSRMTAKTL